MVFFQIVNKLVLNTVSNLNKKNDYPQPQRFKKECSPFDSLLIPN